VAHALPPTSSLGERDHGGGAQGADRAGHAPLASGWV
jgi:hypothetical protein